MESGVHMAGAKKPVKKKSSASRSTAPKVTTAQVALQKQAARDPYRGPSTKQIERSFGKGKTVTLESFRDIIDW